MDTLIIRAELSAPPSESLAVRSLTMLSHDKLNMDNLIEVENYAKDIYYYFLKNKGIWDYIDEIITPPENESGVRIDIEYNFPYTIKTKKIVFANILNLIGQIAYLQKMRV
jgi:hypothetical protein